MRREHFELLGVRVAVQSDASAPLDALKTVYSRYRLRPGGPTGVTPGTGQGHAARVGRLGTDNASGILDARPPLSVTIRSTGPDGPTIELGPRELRVGHVDLLPHYAHLAMVNLVAGVADRTVLHAAAVARGTEVLLIAGRSGWGKTTMALELVRRGWKLLSDDFAPLDPDATVHGFPRAVGLLSDSARLLGVDLPPDSLPLASPEGGRKFAVDPETLFGDCLIESGRLRWVFLTGDLGSPAASAEGAADWEIRVDRQDPGFAAALAELGRPTVVEDGPQPLWRLRDTRPGLVGRLDALALRHGVSIVESRPCAAGAPDRTGDVATGDDSGHVGTGGRPAVHRSDLRFAPTPVAVPVQREEALPALLALDLGLSGRRYLGLEDARPLTALARLRAGVSKAQLWHLTPGPLIDTVDLLEDLAR